LSANKTETNGHHDGHDHPPHPATPETIEKGVSVARIKCGERLTETREAVLRLLLEENRPMTAYELLDMLGNRTGRARNPPTIYRALEFLLGEGFISRLESLNAYTICSNVGQPHACLFFICRCCEEASEVADTNVEELLTALAGKIGFRADHPVVEVDGLCQRCHHEHDDG
jgi:Fur family transcriptional regulator, zinc uptake regulator